MMVDEDHIVRSWAPSGHCNDCEGGIEHEVRTGRATGTDASSLWRENGREDAALTPPVRSEFDGDSISRSMVGNGVNVDVDGQNCEDEDFVEGEDGQTERGGQEILRLNDGDVDVGVTMRRIRTTDTKEPGQAVRKRPKYPPFLFARYPYTYVSDLRLLLFSSRSGLETSRSLPSSADRSCSTRRADTQD